MCKTINTWSIITICGAKIRSYINTLYPGSNEKMPWDILDKYFSIKTDSDWNMLCSAMDLLEDTECAKENYLKFGLSGPTKYNEVGEKYLRLYGILNAIYLQKDAIISLLKYCDLPNIKKEKEFIENIKIVKFRHIAGSHTLNYKDYSNKNSSNKNSYLITRMSLDYGTISFRSGDKFEEINLKEALFEYNKLIGEKIFIIVKFLVKSLQDIDIEVYEKEKVFLDHCSNYFNGKVYTIIEENGIWNVGDINFNEVDIEIYEGEKS